jgi:predicted oxidoreductase
VQLGCRLRPVIGWLKPGRLAAILATGDLIERYKLAVPLDAAPVLLEKMVRQARSIKRQGHGRLDPDHLPEPTRNG